LGFLTYSEKVRAESTVYRPKTEKKKKRRSESVRGTRRVVQRRTPSRIDSS
jgi:hypothetical protein